MIPALEAIFGNPTAAATLLFLQNYESGYASQIAETYGVPITTVKDQLLKLEASGILKSETIGRTRVFGFNPRNPTAQRLKVFLAEELDALPTEITGSYFRERQRPRRTGKHLVRPNK